MFKKKTKLPGFLVCFFIHKMKPKVKIQNLRNTSLEENVINAHTQFYYWGVNIKREI